VRTDILVLLALFLALYRISVYPVQKEVEAKRKLLNTLKKELKVKGKTKTVKVEGTYPEKHCSDVSFVRNGLIGFQRNGEAVFLKLSTGYSELVKALSSLENCGCVAELTLGRSNESKGKVLADVVVNLSMP
jgi:hypothetical protein